MKKSEFKKIIKPIVKECIQEALLEEGLLSSVISEVVKGLGPAPVVEDKQQEQDSFETQSINEEKERRRKHAHETKKKMLDAIGQSSYNGVDLFEGTTPMHQSSESSGPAPFADVAPEDAGVDISALMGKKKIWNTLLEGKK